MQRSSKEALVKSWRLVVHLDCQETCDLDYHETCDLDDHEALDSDEQDAMVLGKSVDSSEMYALDCQVSMLCAKITKMPTVAIESGGFYQGSSRQLYLFDSGILYS